VKEAYWREQIGVPAQSGLTVRAFCRRRGLAENLFYAWRRELAIRDRELAPTEVESASRRTPFVEVVSAPPESSPATPAIEIVLTPASPARRIVIAAGFDPATLSAVLDVLERRAC